MNSEKFHRRKPLCAAHACPEATEGPGTSKAPGSWSASGNPPRGTGSCGWGQLHPPGGVLQPKQEVTLPPGMDEEVEPSRRLEELGQDPGITRQYVAPVEGMAAPAPADPGVQGPVWAAEVEGGQLSRALARLWRRLAADSDQRCHLPGPQFPHLSLGFCGFSFLRHVQRAVKHTDLELEF